MGLFRRLLHCVALVFVSNTVAAEIRRTQRELEREEEKLRCTLARRLKIRREDLMLWLRPSRNGFLIPRLELNVDLTPKQMAEAQRFLDRLTPYRQNARAVPGMH